MKRVGTMLACILCFAMLLSGCGGWFDGEYVNITPYLSEGEEQLEDTGVARSYEELCDALIELVEAGKEEFILYVSDITDDACTQYMDNAISYVKSSTAIGAYAVNKIEFDVGTNAGKRAIAVQVQYLHNRAEILRIKQARSMGDALELIRLALENCDMRLVLRVSEYQDKDLVQFVQNYVNNNPQSCMEEPQLSVMCYPETGKDRIIEVAFQYQSSREALRSMKSLVTDIFKSAQYYVNTDGENLEKYSQLYTFLMERYDYTYETSITPAYSLLRHGVGDSRAFARVYMAMCRQVGLHCQVVSGTKNAEPWCWNVLKIEDTYYHVDLLQCSRQGTFALQTEENMTGYVWDYSAFETE